MKRILAVLALMMVFFAACAKEPVDPATPDTPDQVNTRPTVTEPEPTEPTEPTTLANDRFTWDTTGPVVGVWETTVTLDGALFNLPEMETSVTMSVKYRLNGDATYTRGVDPEEYRKAMDTYEAAMEQFMLDRLYATFSAEKLLDGVKKNQIQKLWEETRKADAEEQAKRFVEGLHLDYRFSQLNGSGDYYAENGKLWFSLEDGSYEYYDYTISDTELTLTAVPNPKMYQQLKLEIPLTLKKAG